MPLVSRLDGISRRDTSDKGTGRVWNPELSRMEVVEAIEQLESLDPQERRFVDEIATREPEWAANRLAVYILTTGGKSPHRYVAPADAAIRGDAIVAHGRWEHALDRASSSGRALAPLAVVERLIVQRSDRSEV
jgi:hypothetical protein